MDPREIWFYYAGGLLLLIVLLFWRRPRRGMRLKLTGGRKTNYKKMEIEGFQPVSAQAAERGERSINCVFNYNGHSWDAYEVLGLPAGSSLENVEAAYRESLSRVEATSKNFVEAAYQAILDQNGSRASG